MTFTIDAGDTSEAARLLPDWFLDQHHGEPEDATLRRYAYHVIGEINRPARMDTARKHMLANLQYLIWAANNAPGHFDEIIVAYAEKALEVT